MFDSGEDSLDKDKTISLCCGSFSNKGKKRKSLSGRYSSRKKSRSNNQEFNKHKTSSGLSVHQSNFSGIFSLILHCNEFIKTTYR